MKLTRLSIAVIHNHTWQ